MSEAAFNELDPELIAAPAEAAPVPVPAVEQLSMAEVLRVPTLRRLWYAQIVSVFGDFLALFAVIDIITFQLHATPQQVTGLNVAYLLPIAVLGVISGVFVDRWPLKLTMVGSDFTRAALCLLLFFVHSIWGFYAVMAAISIFSSFFSPAQGVAIRSAVPFHGLRSANALMQQVMFIMRIIGGPIAIIIVNTFKARACYGLDAVSFLASGSLIASLTLIVPRNPHTEAAAEIQKTSQASAIGRIFMDMKVGGSFILHHAALLFVIVALAAGMFVLGCFGPLIAVYVRDTLHAPSTIFAVTSAAIGIGLLGGVNILNVFAKRIPNTTQVYLGLGGIALGTALLAAAPLAAITLPLLHTTVPVIITVFGCFLIGFACAGIIVPSQTLIQEETPAELMGRVGSTTMSAVFGAQILGLLLSGILADHTSVRSVFAICTAMLAVLIVAGKLWMEPEDHPALA
ncbi:MFS transporter [Granulicella sp. 5B5]|uniref:MFS transporter n=1 Tax=Granulicella sp. 5B5 TaxID=1617967 RepID=UPI0015F554C3|nr:MFS transporter [Granulicella sp. 5B5]QMV19024.1 MFS transporter [Granulicella sp. 5B5]